ncbi:MAG: hypothetical protein H7Y02_11045 [Candidatus Obscuribacterales bacterium]|nr:hypothetical protein [Steroidobacteraceae bacterium]
MKMLNRVTGLIAVLMSMGCASLSAAQVQIVDRATGQALSTYKHRGKLYVAGEPGHEYEIRIHNRSAQRTLAVTSVDGVNVITGETSAVNQSGYVIDAYGFTGIEGWRKSMSHTARFYFTKLPDSYAARTGRPDNVGVIGVALFRERAPCCLEKELRRESDAAGASAPAAQERASADQTSPSRKAESKLGTGHGRSEYSAASYTNFERAADMPNETVVIYYDSRRNLLAQGIIPSHTKYAHRMPQPFPGSFVPDP